MKARKGKLFTGIFAKKVILRRLRNLRPAKTALEGAKLPRLEEEFLKHKVVASRRDFGEMGRFF